MKTILIISPDSIRKPYGGLGVYLQETLKRFPSDYRFLVIGVDTDETHKGINYLYTTLKLYNEVKEASEWLKTCSLIHCMDANTFAYGLQFKKALNIPLIVHVHLSEYQLVKDLSKYMNVGQLPFELGAIELNGILNADHVIHVSHKYAARFPQSDKVSVVWNGINAKDFQSNSYLNVQLPGNPANRKIVFIGRFTYQKGVQNLVNSTIPANTDLYLIGGGQGSNSALTRYVQLQASKKSNVHYLGALWGEEKKAVLQQCDAMIVPSVHEPFGIVALEAMAAGKLLISSRVGGMADFLDSSNYLHCGITPLEITVALAKFSKMQKAEIEKITHTATQEVLPYFTWENAVNKLKTIYQQQLTKHNHEKYKIGLFR